MGNSAYSQGSSTGTHDGDVGSSISEEQHDWPIEQAADTPDIQSLQEMRKPYRQHSSIIGCPLPERTDNGPQSAVRQIMPQPASYIGPTFAPHVDPRRKYEALIKTKKIMKNIWLMYSDNKIMNNVENK